MEQPLNKEATAKLQRPSIKPSKLICKRLFDSPSPSDTQRMMQRMLHSETNRLKNTWCFGMESPTSARSTVSSGENDTDLTKLVSTRRYEWELQDQEKVPSFYTRCMSNRIRDIKKQVKSSEKPQPSVFENKLVVLQSRVPPLPLSCRDENVASACACHYLSPTQSPSFKSPPKIISENLDESCVRLVKALRVPLPSTIQNSLPSTTIPENSCYPKRFSSSAVVRISPDNSSSKKSNVNTRSCNAENNSQHVGEYQAEDTSPSSSWFLRSSASRELFATDGTKKRKARSICTKQRKITDFVQQRKQRNNMAKRRRTADQASVSNRIRQ